MKMMKKLMAVALAGVMALTLLAGCGNPYDLSVKEIMNYIDDENPVTLEISNGETYTQAGVTLKAAADTDAVTLAGLMKDKITAEENKNSGEITILNQNRTALKEQLATKEDEFVAVSCVKVPAMESETIKKMTNYGVASSVLYNRVQLSDVFAKDGSEGTISICIQKIGDANYVFAVIRTPGA